MGVFDVQRIEVCAELHIERDRFALNIWNRSKSEAGTVAARLFHGHLH